MSAVSEIYSLEQKKSSKFTEIIEGKQLQMAAKSIIESNNIFSSSYRCRNTVKAIKGLKNITQNIFENFVYNILSNIIGTATYKKCVLVSTKAKYICT